VFPDIEALSGTGIVENGTSQFEIRVCNVAVWVAVTDKMNLNVLGKGHTPEDRYRAFGGLEDTSSRANGS
jgi:hypothetical protein